MRLSGRLDDGEEVLSTEVTVRDAEGRIVTRRIEGIEARSWAAWVETFAAEKERFRDAWEKGIVWVDREDS